MRIILYTVSLLALSAAAQSFAAETTITSTCNDSLRQRMKESGTLSGTCEVTIAVGDESITKKFHTKLDGESVAEAKLLVREVCEECGTKGTIQKYAVDFNGLTNKILKSVMDAELNGQTVSERSDERVADSCDTSDKTAEEVFSCRLAKLNKISDPTEAAEFYQEIIEPEMTQLATSKNEGDKVLLQKVVMTFYSSIRNGAARSRTVIDSVEQFNHFVSYRNNLIRINRDMEANRQFPQTVAAMQNMKRAAVAQAEAFFTNQSALTPTRDIKQNKNGDVLLEALRKTAGTTGVSPASTPGVPNFNNQPRVSFGRPGGMPVGGAAPRRTNGSPFNPY